MKRRAASPLLPRDLNQRPQQVQRVPTADDLSSASFSSPQSALPLDILELLFSFIPHHPRIAVVSLVCRRWRRATFRSIYDLRLPPMCINWTWMGTLVPNVTSLEAQEIDGSFVPPPRLRRLVMKKDGLAKCMPTCAAKRFIGITSLTDLTLYLNCRHAEGLLNTVRSQVICLSFTAKHWADQGQLPSLRLYFPHLRRIECVEPATYLPGLTGVLAKLLGPFIRRHLSQLTSVSYYESTKHFTEEAANFPKLASLHPTLALASPSPVRDIVEDELLLRSPGLLTRLDTYHLGTLPAQHVLALSKFTNIRSLVVRSLDLDELCQLLCVYTNLVTLRLQQGLEIRRPLGSVLGSLPHLANLWYSPGDVITPPKLHHVTVHMRNEFDLAIEYARAHLRSSVQLRSITIRLSYQPSSVPDKAILQAFLSECEERGMEQVTLPKASIDFDVSQFKWTKISA